MVRYGENFKDWTIRSKNYLSIFHILMLEVKMGIIYMVTSPSGKSYIGQTVRTFNERWSKHKTTALYEEPSCRALAEAIKKYGEETFKKEILVTCNDDELDKYEVEMIAKYNTMSPCGYNLREGGITTKYSEESKKKMSETQKKLYQESEKMREQIKNNGFKTKHNQDLPDYLTEEKNYKTNTIIGYRIYRHPMCKKGKKFCSIKVSLEENYRKAFECLTYLNSLTEPIEYITPPVIGRKREGDASLPKYVIEVKDKSKKVVGYSVSVRNKDKKIHKNFVNKNLTLEEMKQHAIEYLNKYVINA